MSLGSSEASVCRQRVRFPLLQLYLSLSKQMPCADVSVAHLQPEVALLPGLQKRSKSHVESQGWRAQTPLTQSRPGAQALPQRPQLSLSIFASWQVPLQVIVPRPLQLGVGEVEVVELVDVIFREVELALRVVDGNSVVLKDVELDIKDVEEIVALSVIDEDWPEDVNE